MMNNKMIEMNVKNLLKINEDSIHYSERENVKTFQKYIKKEFWNVWNICPAFDKVASDLHGYVIGIDSAEIFSNPYIDDDYFCENSGKMDIFISAYFATETIVKQVCFSVAQTFQMSYDEKFDSVCNNGIIWNYSEFNK